MPLLPVGRLELEPVARPDTGPVRAVDAFGDDALHVELGAGVEQLARCADERPDRAPARTDKLELLEQTPPFRIRELAQVVVVEDEQM